jgi:hypothetical protein
MKKLRRILMALLTVVIVAAIVVPVQARPATVRLRQSGRLRTGVESEQWLSFTADEVIAHDARVALQSAITIAADRGSRDLDTGTVQRVVLSRTRG